MRPLSPANVLLLTLPPLLWAGNAVAGRLMHGLVPPMTLNFLRWLLAGLLLLPLAHRLLRRDSALWPHWRRFALLGLLGVGCYNALQYLALKTSTPINVTLVAASIPVWMLLVGRLLFGQHVSPRQLLGALLSLSGVALVLAQGRWQQLLALQWVVGDLYMLLAALCWALYSWLLARPAEPAALRADWAAFLFGQIVFGLGWSGLFAGGEWLLAPGAHITWNTSVAVTLLYIAVGPALLAYRCWGLGVQRVGPATAGFFANLAPLFAALMSAALLGEPPQPYHALAFALIVGGIVVSSRR